jgi:hypothetical protein
MKYLKIYVKSGTYEVKHLAVKDTPFNPHEGIAGDADDDIDEYEATIDGEPDVVSASELIGCIKCQGNGRFIVDQESAEKGIKNVVSRGLSPTLNKPEFCRTIVKS